MKLNIGDRVLCTKPNIKFDIGDELTVSEINIMGYGDTHRALNDKDGIEYVLIGDSEKLEHCEYASISAQFKVVKN